MTLSLLVRGSWQISLHVYAIDMSVRFNHRHVTGTRKIASIQCVVDAVILWDIRQPPKQLDDAGGFLCFLIYLVQQLPCVGHFVYQYMRVKIHVENVAAGFLQEIVRFVAFTQFVSERPYGERIRDAKHIGIERATHAVDVGTFASAATFLPCGAVVLLVGGVWKHDTSLDTQCESFLCLWWRQKILVSRCFVKIWWLQLHDIHGYLPAQICYLQHLRDGERL